MYRLKKDCSPHSEHNLNGTYRHKIGQALMSPHNDFSASILAIQILEHRFPFPECAMSLQRDLAFCFSILQDLLSFSLSSGALVSRMLDRLGQTRKEGFTGMGVGLKDGGTSVGDRVGLSVTAETSLLNHDKLLTRVDLHFQDLR